MYKNILKYNCYSSHNLCSSISFNKNGSCDKCLEKYGIQNMNNLHSNYSYQMNLIVSEVKLLLDECEKAKGREAKAIASLKTFDILSKNLYFFFEHKKFLITVINKCNEFKNEEIFDKILISNPEYRFSRDFIKNLNKFYEENINYDMTLDDKILNDFDIFISDYMDNYIELNKIDKSDNKIIIDDKKHIEKIKNNYVYCDEIIKLDI